VLPFANLSDDREQHYFADRITEDLATDLSQLANMLVISRNSAFTCWGSRVPRRRPPQFSSGFAPKRSALTSGAPKPSTNQP
jgi:TolB-like protein